MFKTTQVKYLLSASAISFLLVIVISLWSVLVQLGLKKILFKIKSITSQVFYDCFDSYWECHNKKSFGTFFHIIRPLSNSSILVTIRQRFPEILIMQNIFFFYGWFIFVRKPRLMFIIIMWTAYFRIGLNLLREFCGVPTFPSTDASILSKFVL